MSPETLRTILQRRDQAQPARTVPVWKCLTIAAALAMILDLLIHGPYPWM
jgi:hypothetical protein